MARKMKVNFVRSTVHERLEIAGLLISSMGLVQLTLWKESEVFWLNLGGYPIWLRESVKALYYPYLFFVLSFALIVTRSVIGRLYEDFRLRRAWFLLLVSWIIIFSSLGLLLANNLNNLMEGRSIHYHDTVVETRSIRSED
ncbi:MAG: hypothetical protein ACPGSB_08970 [Opitutales bacterium]